MLSIHGQQLLATRNTATSLSGKNVASNTSVCNCLVSKFKALHKEDKKDMNNPFSQSQDAARVAEAKNMQSGFFCAPKSNGRKYI